MTLADEKIHVVPSPVTTGPTDPLAGRRLFSGEEYEKLSDLGFFNNERVELIGGVIYTMAPMHNRHGVVLARLYRKLYSTLDPQLWWVRSQMTLQLQHGMPDPDLAVVPGPETHVGTYPTTAALVIEVSDTTLVFDRTKKMSLYASAQIPEYWIINVEARQVEVHTRPIPDESQPFAFRYADVKTYLPTEALPLSLLPNTNLPLAEFLP